MQMNNKSLASTLVVVAGLVISGCNKGASTSPAPATPAAPPASAVPQMSAAPAAPAVQAGQAQAPVDPAKPVHEGKVKVDPTQKFTHFRVGEKNVKSIYADGKVIWVGTSGGVIRYDTGNDTFKLFDTSNGLLSNGTFYVGKIQGLITVGTYGGGLSMLQKDGVTWKNYNIPQGVGDSFVYGMIEARNGDIWIATWSGANRVRGGALDDFSKWDLFTVENTRGGLPNDWVYGVTEGRNGDIWLATEGGMARFADGKWDNWNHAKGMGAPFEKVKNNIEYKNDMGKLSDHHARQKKEMGLEGVDVAYNPNYVVSLLVDHDGQVWAGTWGGGLSRYDGKRWKSYTTVEGLPGNHVFMLHEDRKQQLWIGTNKGLALWQDGKFKVMTRADGLFADDVFTMATTEDGGKWLGSYGGVTFLRPSNDLASLPPASSKR
jgi:ligand-binding sensor domain-containing protein